MFCPKCGTKNPDNGKYCRTCGTNLSPVSAALGGAPLDERSSFGVRIETSGAAKAKREKMPKWDGAVSSAFVGVAFIIVSVILGITNAGNSSKWWFWMLIPGFACLGTGIAQIIQLRKNERRSLPAAPAEDARRFAAPPAGHALPATETEYISPESRFKTGELAAPPPSVTEHTTRHLEINNEGETMTLPKK